MSAHKQNHKSTLAMLAFALFIHAGLLWRSCEGPTKIKLAASGQVLRLSLPNKRSLDGQNSSETILKTKKVNPPIPPANQSMRGSTKGDVPPPLEKFETNDIESLPGTGTPIGEAAPSGAINLVLGGIEGSIGEYEALLLDHIRSHEFYPKAAQMRHLEGDVSIEFAVSSDGKLMDLNISASSGHEILDSAAKEILLSSTPFPPPSGFGLGARTYVLPLYFRALQK